MRKTLEVFGRLLRRDLVLLLLLLWSLG
ncbi:hypothetical protein Mgra_00007416 [Meloidogyne graminicola]|uniref:Uncharacterized protein n=1 Tax=Meloidogyne graminicola TaxID=189291 RepID=A0A8S9ZIP5_9BILA|nr:hypothetical protein Mgra_00007416 [Meloidogyne graminicola]